MRTVRPSITFKLPAEFVERHREAIDAIDWRATPTFTLDLGWPINPVLEAVAGRGTTIVRPATVKSANLIRKSCGEAVVDPADTAAALAARNPKDPT